MLRDPAEAERLMRHQIAVAPSPYAYKFLVGIFAVWGRPADAIEVAQDAIERYPEDRDFPALLGELLLDVGRPADAAVVLSAEAGRRPRSSRLHVRLGAAYLRTGDAARGLAALEQAVLREAGPNIWNDAARELADAGLELGRAREWAERAVARTHEENAGLEMARVPRLVPNTSQRMAYYMETLGRILLAQGEHERAWGYCLTAWELNVRPRAADCLATVAMGRSDTETATFYARQAEVPFRMEVRGPGDPFVFRQTPQMAAQFGGEFAAQFERHSVDTPRPEGVTGHVVLVLTAIVGPDGRVLDLRVDGGRPLVPVDVLLPALRGLKAGPAMPDGGTARLARSANLNCRDGQATCVFSLVTN